MDNLGILPKFALTASCISPVLFTYAFIVWHKTKEGENHYYIIALLIVSAILLAFICVACLDFVSKKTHSEPISVTSFKPADKEISGYFVSYLMPLISATSEFIEIGIAVFFSLMFFLFIFVSKSFYSNPMLSIFGYKFYEITIDTGGSLLLITRENIVNVNQINNIAYATRYTVVMAKD
ncbi:hypothetical protein [Zymobacter palmae]|uniref:hypothetical protein n=1 Tax=Zymobacter palmae TaxID=33074 RepID=UPI0006885F3F|nr:hypothetical protein [Zymobacter palmae]